MNIPTGPVFAIGFSTERKAVGIDHAVAFAILNAKFAFGVAARTTLTTGAGRGSYWDPVIARRPSWYDRSSTHARAVVGICVRIRIRVCVCVGIRICVCVRVLVVVGIAVATSTTATAFAHTIRASTSS